jgi:hypothetical protein
MIWGGTGTFAAIRKLAPSLLAIPPALLNIPPLISRLL